MILRVVGLSLLLAASISAQEPNSAAIEALGRLKGMDLEANPALKNAVLKILEKTKGTPQFVEIVRDFKLTGQREELLKFAAANSTNSIGIEALRLAASEGGAIALSPGIIEAMANAADKHFVPALTSAIQDSQHPIEARKSAVKGLAQTEEGSTLLLKLASEEKLDPGLRFAATTALHSARWENIKAEAAKILPLPQGKAAALPPVSELVKLKGDPAHGAKIFRGLEMNCVNCHRVGNEGVDFGPALTEIGSKLAREAIYEAILDPSSGISFGFEAWQVEMKNGDETYGIITSETPEEIVVKVQTGVSTRYKKAEIASRRQMKTSIMPAGLQMAVSQQDLVDLVEYLSTLKKH